MKLKTCAKVDDIGRIIGQVAITGCLKLLTLATMMSFMDNRCYSAEVVMARLNEVALSQSLLDTRKDLTNLATKAWEKRRL